MQVLLLLRILPSMTQASNFTGTLTGSKCKYLLNEHFNLQSKKNVYMFSI